MTGVYVVSIIHTYCNDCVPACVCFHESHSSTFLRLVGGCASTFCGELLVKCSITTRRSRSTLSCRWFLWRCSIALNSAWILSAPCSPIMPNPTPPHFLIQGTMWSSKRWSFGVIALGPPRVHSFPLRGVKGHATICTRGGREPGIEARDDGSC